MMSFVFSVLPENLADVAVDVALALAVVAFTAMLIERLCKPRNPTP